jgi:hypothetical protein
MEAYALLHALIIIAVYQDVQSGKRLDRTAYGRLLDDLQAGETVLCWRLDRGGRNAEEMLRFRRVIEERRASLVFVTEPETENRLMYTIKAGMAEEESRRLRERVLPTMQHVVEVEHRYVSKAPTWYRLEVVPRIGKQKRQFAPGEGRLIPDEPYPGAAARCWEMILRTNNLSAAARAHGITYDALREMIHNPAYCGDTRWNGLTVPETHPALVPRDLWEQVRALRRDTHHTYVRRVEGIAMLTGLIYRADTDERLSRRVRNGDTAWARDFYVSSARGAPYIAVRCEDADETVVARLMELDLAPAAVREIERDARRAVHTDPAAKRRASLTAALARLADERTEATRALLRGALTDADLVHVRTEQDTEERDLRAQIAALPPVPDVAAVVTAARGRVRLAAQVEAAWERQDIDALRAVCRRYIARVEIWGAESPGVRAAAKRNLLRKHPPRLHIVWIGSG